MPETTVWSKNRLCVSPGGYFRCVLLRWTTFFIFIPSGKFVTDGRCGGSMSSINTLERYARKYTPKDSAEVTPVSNEIQPMTNGKETDNKHQFHTKEKKPN